VPTSAHASNSILVRPPVAVFPGATVLAAKAETCRVLAKFLFFIVVIFDENGTHRYSNLVEERESKETYKSRSMDSSVSSRSTVSSERFDIFSLLRLTPDWNMAFRVFIRIEARD
jgi:hypothetical protein